ncbi:MAG: RsmE family RNA methyltransferase, partial [Elusimicrobiota bacterium]
MPQFLVSPEEIEGNRFLLQGPEAFHLTRVLRFKEGQAIEVFDGKGGRYSGVIEAIRADGSVEGRVTGTLHAPHAAVAVKLTLYLGLMKASRWEWALEKGAEVGVSRFVPVLTPRTVVQLREGGASTLVRWKKILLAASKQCGRADIPEIKPAALFRDAVEEACGAGLTLLGWEKMPKKSTSPPLHEALARSRGKGEVGVSLFIGPEGGFSEEEVELAELEGAHLFHLG